MESEILWRPKDPQSSQMAQFMQALAQHVQTSFSTYHELYEYSIKHPNAFWSFFVHWSELLFSGSPEPAVEHYQFFGENPHIPPVFWFPDMKLCLAENMLKPFQSNQRALIQASEKGVEAEFTFNELEHQMKVFREALVAFRFYTKDVFAALMPNRAETLFAFLGVNALGGVWTSTSPDFGSRGVLDRFTQVKPKILFTVDGYYYKGKAISLVPKLKEIIPALPTLTKVVVLPILGEEAVWKIEKTISYQDFLSAAQLRSPDYIIRTSFDQPLYIMYSSGTTGLPKCMVQGNGVFINHLKEHRLHLDIRSTDTFFYFTTCGWMMWNWLISGLASGATVVLYDGNPLYPTEEILWQLCDEVGITVFGTSARYLAYLEQKKIPIKQKYSLKSLRAILSTGSVLDPSTFSYVYQNIKEDIMLASISGGTDLNGCFALGNPLLPVKKGELQSRGLGMAVQVYNEKGEAVTETQGELVCEKPFPSMPLYFYNDFKFKKYRSAYFEKYPGVWAHGDFALLTKEGSLILYGRSDATLNPGGVRIGTAEIYRALAGLAEVEDSVAVGQTQGSDERILLFVQLAPGVSLDESLVNKIKTTIREKASPRHVPEVIHAVPDIPYTISMKKVEIAIRRILEGGEAKNKDALANPEALDYFYQLRDKL